MAAEPILFGALYSMSLSMYIYSVLFEHNWLPGLIMQLMLVLKRVVLYLHYAMGELEVVTKITYISTITGSLSLTRLILIFKIHFSSKSEGVVWSWGIS